MTPPAAWVDAAVDNSVIDFQDYAIGGKLIGATLTLTAVEAMQVTGSERQYIKEKLAVLLAKAMIENGLVEFTQLDNPSTMGKMIHARCYLAPNDQVKIIRQMK